MGNSPDVKITSNVPEMPVVASLDKTKSIESLRSGLKELATSVKDKLTTDKNKQIQVGVRLADNAYNTLLNSVKSIVKQLETEGLKDLKIQIGVGAVVNTTGNTGAGRVSTSGTLVGGRYSNPSSVAKDVARYEQGEFARMYGNSADIRALTLAQSQKAQLQREMELANSLKSQLDQQVKQLSDVQNRAFREQQKIEQQQIAENQKNALAIEKQRDKQMNDIDYNIAAREKEAARFSSLMREWMKEEQQLGAANLKLQSVYASNDGIKNNKMLSNAYEKLNQDLENNSISANEAKKRVDLFEQAVSSAGYSTAMFGDKVKNVFGFLKRYTSTFMIFAQLANIGKQMVSSVKEIDAALVEFNKVADLTDTRLETIADKAFTMGAEIGRTGTDVINAATEFKRAGYDISASMDMARAALVMTNVGDAIKETSEAASILISTLRGFEMSDSDSMAVVDKINEVANTAPISFEDISEGLTRVAGTLHQSGTTIDETIGLITGGFSQLRNVQKVSSGLLMISQRLRGVKEDGEAIDGLVPKLERAFGEVGVAIQDEQGNLRSVYDILSDYSKVYDTLSSKQKQYLNSLAAGNRQVAVLNAIMQQWGDVQSAIDSSINSLGSAERENAIFMDSIEGRTNKLKSTVQQLAETIVDKNVMKSIISGGAGVVETITKITKAVGGLSLPLSALTGVLGAKGLGLFSQVGKGVGLTGFLTSYTKSDINIFNKYNEQILAGADAQRSLAEALKSASPQAQQLLYSVKGGIVPLQEFDKGARMAAIGVGILNTAINIGLSVAISAAIKLIGDWISQARNAAQAAQELAQESKQQYETLRDESATLDELVAKYKEVRNSANYGKEEQREIAGIQSQIVDILGVQASTVDLINGTYAEQSKILDGIVEKQKQSVEQAREVMLINARLATEKAVGPEHGFLGAGDFNFYRGSASEDVRNIINQGMLGAAGEDAANTVIGRIVSFILNTGLLLPQGVPKNSSVSFGIGENGGIETNKQIGFGETIGDFIAGLVFPKLEEAQKNATEKAGADYTNLFTKLLKNGLIGEGGNIGTFEGGAKGNSEKLQQILDIIKEEAPNGLRNDTALQDWYSSIYRAKEYYDGLLDDLYKTAIVGLRGSIGETVSNVAGTDLGNLKDMSPEELEHLYEKLLKNVVAGSELEVTFADCKRELDAWLAENYPELLLKTADSFESVLDASVRMADSLAASKDAIGDAKDELDKYGNISVNTLDGIAAKYEELQPQIDKYKLGLISATELIEDMEKAYQDDYNAFVDELNKKLYTDEEYYASLKSDSDSWVVALANAYGIDLDNFNTLEELKAQADAKLLNSLTGNWAAYVGMTIESVQAQYDALMAGVGYMGLGGVVETDLSSDLSNYASRLKTVLDDMKDIQNRFDANKFTPTITSSKNSGAGSSSKSGSGSGSKSSTDTHLEAYKNAVAELDHLRAMDMISEQEYYDRLKALSDQYLAGREQYVSEYRSVEEKLWSYQKQLYEKDRDAQIKAAEDSAKAQKDAAKAAYDAQKKAIEDRKKLYDEDKKNYKELIDAKKKLLDDETDQRSHNERVAELNKEIADLETKLEILSLDNSAKANARKVELRKELLEKQKSLEDEQYDWSVDKQKDALDEEYERYEKNVDSQIDLLDQQLDALQASYDAQIDQIERASQAVIDGINAQFDALINRSQTAAQELANTVDGLTQQIAASLANINVSTSSGIAQMQSVLVGEGYNLGNYGPNRDGVDGIMGKMSTKGLQELLNNYFYQGAIRFDGPLKVDGIIGPKTRAAIAAAIAAGLLDSSFATFHTGGIVGGSRNALANIIPLNDSEVVAKLLRNEAVLTEDQQASVRKAFASLVASNPFLNVDGNSAKAMARLVGATGGNTVNVTNVFEGNVDSDVMRKLENWSDKFKREMRDNMFGAMNKHSKASIRSF